MMNALASLKRDGKTPPVRWWRRREHTYRGVLRLCEGLTAAGAVVAEPTE
jgi:acetylornithine deacetylase